MVKLIVSMRSFDSPSLYIKNLGKIDLSKMYLDNSEFYIKMANSLYTTKELNSIYEKINLDKGDLEGIISLAKKKLQIEDEFKETQVGIKEIRKKLRDRYKMPLPKILRHLEDKPEIKW